MSELSKEWADCSLGQISLDVSYGYTAKSNADQGNARMLRITDIQNNKVNWDEVPFCEIDQPDLEKYSLKKGDLVFARTGATVGKSFLIRDDVERAVFASYLIRVRPFHSEMAPYLSHFFGTPAYWSQIIDFSAGIGQPNVNGSKLKQLRIPLAPALEQKRIADKLDAVLARVDACRGRLDRVPAILKRFRQSVLAAATSGALTEDWRTKDTPEWAFERAVDVCSKVQSGGTPKEGFTNQGIPFLKVYNIVNQKVDFDYKPQHIAVEVHNGSMAKSKALPGDVLMNIVGPPLGKVAIVPTDFPEWNINQAITLFRPSDRISTGWLYCVLCGGENIAEIVHETRGSAGQTNISLSQCRDFIFPVPSIEEQAEIVRRVEALFIVADRLEARYAAARTQVEKLTPSLLAKAFRGELVPQDPNDEPASVLLERIRAQRDETAPAKAARKGKRAASPDPAAYPRERVSEQA